VPNSHLIAKNSYLFECQIINDTWSFRINEFVNTLLQFKIKMVKLMSNLKIPYTVLLDYYWFGLLKSQKIEDVNMEFLISVCIAFVF
jgi:hypothetical protein